MQRTALTLLLTVASFSAALAGGTEPAGAMQRTGMTGVAGMSMDTRARMQSVTTELERLSGRAFDRAFLSVMISHHQMAVDMARVELTRGRDALVRGWAQDIIDEQTREIAEMERELATLGGPDTRLQALLRSRMSGMTEMLRTAANPDRMFLEMMVPHHGGANDLATLELERGEDKDVLRLAKQILTSQADQMHDFRDWLRANP